MPDGGAMDLWVLQPGGKLMAELIVSGEAPVEIRPFSLARFTTGDLITEPTIIGLAKDNPQRQTGD